MLPISGDSSLVKPAKDDYNQLIVFKWACELGESIFLDLKLKIVASSPLKKKARLQSPKSMIKEY